MRLDAVVEKSHVEEPLTIIKISSNTKKNGALQIFETESEFYIQNSNNSIIAYKKASRTGAV